MPPPEPPSVEELKAKNNVKGLIKVLSHQEASISEAAAEALVEIGAPAVKSLLSALKDEERLVREAAAWALGQIGDARAVEPLIAALQDSEIGVRIEATAALSELSDARAVEPLIVMLRDSDKSVRRVAALSLGLLGAARAVAPLRALLKDSEEYVRVGAEAGLALLGHYSVAEVEEPLAIELSTGVRQAMEARDQAARDEWIRQGRPGAGRSHQCKMCGKTIYGEETVIEMQKQAIYGNAGGPSAAQQWEKDSGYRCTSCGSEYCKDCLEKKAPGNVYGGKSCPNCGGLFEIMHG